MDLPLKIDIDEVLRNAAKSVGIADNDEMLETARRVMKGKEAQKAVASLYAETIRELWEITHDDPMKSFEFWRFIENCIYCAIINNGDTGRSMKENLYIFMDKAGYEKDGINWVEKTDNNKV